MDIIEMDMIQMDMIVNGYNEYDYDKDGNKKDS
jgi:hypothetical protein